MFETIWSTLYGLLVDDGQLAVGAIVALAIAWVIAYAGGDRAHEVVGWVLLTMVLVLVVASLYRAGLRARRAISARR